MFSVQILLLFYDRKRSKNFSYVSFKLYKFKKENVLHN